MLKLLAIPLLFSATALAQEVGYLDLTGVTPRTTLRYPRAPPPKTACKNGICLGVSGGFGSLAIACGAGSPSDPRAIKTTVTWLDQLDYQIGDNVEVEIKLENTGSETMMIPWTPHLADLQLADESKAFDYLELDLTLDIKTDSAMVSLPLKTLYGSKAEGGTLIELLPGAWVHVRDSVKLVVNDVARKHVEQQQGAPWEANAHFGYRHDSFHPGPGGYSTMISNDYPRDPHGDPLLVRIYSAGTEN
jgi:hypothetical protein